MDIRDDLRESSPEVQYSEDEDDEYARGHGMYEPLYPYRVDDGGESDNSVHNITRKRPGSKRKPKYAVKRDFKIDEPNPVEMTKLVIEYLVIEGYPDAAKALAAEANVKLDEQDWESIEKRVAIKKDLVAGNIAEAIDKLNVLCPEMIEHDDNVRFDLYLQRFLELIKEDDIVNALEWSSEKMSAEDLDDDKMARLEQACTLAAFGDPTECRFYELLEQGQRDAVAESVNSAILRVQGKPSCSRVETMFKMKMFMTMSLPHPSGNTQQEADIVAEAIHADIVNGAPPEGRE
ncbi:tag-304 [Pristionchus pacificus]|uniref:Tag-304 protein n=1 Tax=Pristionchus pacificus TaxID=54126 RepID=A0A454Y4N5_PRIPA|nr:tag-304 [Pristionchus pacificus]|eukprot:PDM68500.1 tag-304 protein [Pristionchus pacificus]